MSEEYAAQQPTPQHRMIQESVGVWTVECNYFMDPSQPPMQLTAKETIRALGAFFTVSTFEADMFGQPFQGQATMGYDPARERWEATWCDTMSPYLFHFTGSYDDQSKQLTMEAQAPSPHNGELTNWRSVETRQSKDQRTFEMFMALPEGGEVKILAYTYRRVKN
jgi:hypothetical protein